MATDDFDDDKKYKKTDAHRKLMNHQMAHIHKTLLTLEEVLSPNSEIHTLFHLMYFEMTHEMGCSPFEFGSRLENNFHAIFDSIIYLIKFETDNGGKYVENVDDKIVEHYKKCLESLDLGKTVFKEFIVELNLSFHEGRPFNCEKLSVRSITGKTTER